MVDISGVIVISSQSLKTETPAALTLLGYPPHLLSTSVRAEHRIYDVIVTICRRGEVIIDIIIAEWLQ